MYLCGHKNCRHGSDQRSILPNNLSVTLGALEIGPVQRFIPSCTPFTINVTRLRLHSWSLHNSLGPALNIICMEIAQSLPYLTVIWKVMMDWACEETFKYFIPKFPKMWSLILYFIHHRCHKLPTAGVRLLKTQAFPSVNVS